MNPRFSALASPGYLHFRMYDPRGIFYRRGGLQQLRAWL